MATQKSPPPAQAEIEAATNSVVANVNAGAPVYDQNGAYVDMSDHLAYVRSSIGWCYRIQGVTVQSITDWILAQFAPYPTVATPGGASHMPAWEDQLGKSHDFDTRLETQFASGRGPKPTPAFDATQASNGANIDNAKRGQGFYGMDGKNHYLAPGFVPENPDPAFVAARAALLAAYPDAPPTPAPTPTPDPGPTGFPGIG